LKLEMGKNLETFKGCVSLMTKILEDACLVVTKEGIHVLAMDPSHVAMTDLHIKPELFETFTASDEEEKVFLNVKELIKFLDRLGKDEDVTLETSAEKDTVPRLSIIAKKQKAKRRFSIDLLEPSEEEVPKPKIFFKSQARILTRSLKQGMADAALVSEHCRITASGEKISIRATGDLGSSETEWEKGSDDLLDLKAEEESTATYTLNYLTDLIGAAQSLSEEVIVELSTDMPLKLSFDTGKINCQLYLAPCIGCT